MRKMRNAVSLRMFGIAAVAVAGIAGVAWNQWSQDTTPNGRGEMGPQLSAAALAGKAAYDTNCAECHGRNGAGTDKGPPFVHPVYNPGHHADMSFVRAVAQGVRQHHWKFGDMPAQPQVSAEQLAGIVRYVRAVQEAHGITGQPHKN